MRYAYLFLAVACLGFTLAPGCKDKEHEQRLSNLEGAVTELYDFHREKAEGADSMFTKDRALTLDTSDQGYYVLNSDTGVFFVTLKEAAPYLDGYNLQLSVGNPMNATYNGATLKIWWGPGYDPGKGSYEDWEKSLSYKEVKVADELTAGYWTDVDAILSPASSEDMKTVRLAIETDKVQLLRK